jgi:putative tricarboxylic transport membrane protein
MNDLAKERFFGGLMAVFSLAYLRYAAGIEDSMLADSVGASGIPLALGSVMLIASVGLLLKSFFITKPPVDAADSSADSEAPTPAEKNHSLRMAAGLLAILTVYALVLPTAGYAISISLLVFAIAVLAGASFNLTLAMCTALSGVAFWFLFQFALGIAMPKGALFA